MSDIGHCKHGEFVLVDGCPMCIAEAYSDYEMRESVEKPIRDAIERVLATLVKVQYYSETTGELSPREYTYYSIETLKVGDIVVVPVRDTTGKAKVSAVDVPEAEIANFKDKVKIIPAGSIIPPSGGLAAAAQEAGADVTVVEMKMVMEPPLDAINLCDTCNQDLPQCQNDGVVFGDGLGNDNVIKCDGYTSTETAVALRPGEDIEVHGYYMESVRILELAEDRVIASLEDNKAANDDLTIISRLKKAMGAKKIEKLEPSKVEQEAIRDTYNYLMNPILEAEQITKQKMLAYDAEQCRIRNEQESINRKRIEAAEAEMKLKGELTESVNVVEVTAQPAKTTRTEMGTSSKVDVWKFEVVDPNALPREYMIPDLVMLGQTAKTYHDKKPIPGVRFYNEPTISTRAR